MLRPCQPCRSRKLRCDGAQPTCASCARARKSLLCVYDTSENGRASRCDLLTKGAACMACRRKKKKCDGSRPFCSTCKVAGKEDDCQYEDGMHLSVRAQLELRIEELEAKLQAYDQNIEINSCQNQNDIDSLSAVPSCEVVQQGQMLSKSDNLVSSGSSIVPHAATIADDVDLAPIRSVFFTHRGQVGLCLTEPRLEALKAGDLSVIHPVLLYAAQLWGCLVNEDSNGYFRLLTESAQLQSALDCIKDARNAIDATTALEAHQLLCMAFFMKGDVFKGREQILKASHVALQHDLHILSLVQSINQQGTYRSVTLSADEDMGAICQLLYIDQSHHLEFHTPLIFPDNLYNELQALPDMYSGLAIDSFCIAARAVSLQQLREGKKIVAKWSEEGCCPTRSDMWYSSYQNLLQKAHVHLAHIQTRLINTMMTSDDLHSRALKIAELISLCVLVDLHSVLAPTVLEARQASVEAVTQVMVITESFKQEDYARLCPMVCFCWASCVKTIRAEIGTPYPLFTADEASRMLSVIKSNSELLSRKMLYVNVHIEMDRMDNMNTPASARFS